MRHLTTAIFGAAVLLPLAARAELYYLIVSGLGGEPAYAESFAASAGDMASAAERTLGTDSRVTLLSGEDATRDALRGAFADLAAILQPVDRLAVFLIGHGTHDGDEYKFNLPGPDITGSELAELLTAVPAVNQVVVNATSASGAVLESWSADGRTVITGTRSGRERNATTFAEQWARALSADDADLNKNGSISAQEAFDYTARLVAESYESEGTLATEHPELRGEAASAFEISRLTARVAATPAVAALNDRAAELEEEIAALRLRRAELSTEEYTAQMLDLQVELALLQEQIDAGAVEE